MWSRMATSFMVMLPCVSHFLSTTSACMSLMRMSRRGDWLLTPFLPFCVVWDNLTATYTIHIRKLAPHAENCAHAQIHTFITRVEYSRVLALHAVYAWALGKHIVLQMYMYTTRNYLTASLYNLYTHCTLLHTYLVDNQLDGDVFEHIPGHVLILTAWYKHIILITDTVKRNKFKHTLLIDTYTDMEILAHLESWRELIEVSEGVMEHSASSSYSSSPKLDTDIRDTVSISTSCAALSSTGLDTGFDCMHKIEGASSNKSAYTCIRVKWTWRLHITLALNHT